jgi:YwiC-like protein
MNSTKDRIRPVPLIVRHVALPQDHGSWVFLLSPLLIGIFAANNWNIAMLLLILAAFAGFLIRQPVTIAVKVYSGRRARRELPTAWFWITIYGLLGAASSGGLMILGYGYLLYLSIPGIPVFGWHLYLVSKREERRQMRVELAGSGVLALAAPAAYWVGIGNPATLGWLLFLLVWLQSVTSIVYAYFRLGQRLRDQKPNFAERFRNGWRAILCASSSFGFVGFLSIISMTPAWLFTPYMFQWLETLYGVFLAPINVKPVVIGIRQLIVSTIFTLLFIITWNI